MALHYQGNENDSIAGAGGDIRRCPSIGLAKFLFCAPFFWVGLIQHWRNDNFLFIYNYLANYLHKEYQLISAVLLVKNGCSEEELNVYQGAVGEVMGDILTEIMNPPYKRHPTLKPKELR
jgi:hypothetical protein